LVAGSGYHVMARDQLERYREAVADDRQGAELRKLVAKAEEAGLEVWGESLATAPRGYPKDHERIALLRRKSLSLGATIDSDRGIGRADGLRFVTRTWRAAAPVTGWLDEHVGATTMPVDTRYRRRSQAVAAPSERVSDSLMNEVRCGDAEGSLSGRGCEGCDLGAASGGRERGRDRPPAGPAEADGE
jgi:hypothetical protein